MRKPVTNRKLIQDVIDHLRGGKKLPVFRMDKFFVAVVRSDVLKLQDIRTCTTAACLAGTAIILYNESHVMDVMDSGSTSLDDLMMTDMFVDSEEFESDGDDSDDSDDIDGGDGDGGDDIDGGLEVAIGFSSCSEITIGARLFGISYDQGKQLFFDWNWPKWARDLSELEGAIALLEKILIDGPEFLNPTRERPIGCALD